MTELSISVDAESTPQALQAMHSYCVTYRDLVRGGGIPTEEQDEKFLAFQKVCYGKGIAHADH